MALRGRVLRPAARVPKSSFAGSKKIVFLTLDRKSVDKNTILAADNARLRHLYGRADEGEGEKKKKTSGASASICFPH